MSAFQSNSLSNFISEHKELFSINSVLHGFLLYCKRLFAKKKLTAGQANQQQSP